jgi:uncharacterized membrane protein HdeD (DUF308 family)
MTWGEVFVVDQMTHAEPGGVISTFARNWWLFVLRGVAAIVFGIIAIVYPDVTITALAIVFGIYAIVDSIGSFASAIGHRGADGWHRAAHALEGVVALVAGVLALVLPDLTALALVVLIGLWAILSGVVEIMAAIRLRRMIDNEWLLGISGLLSIIAGMVILVWPDAGALAISWLIGTYAILFGIFFVWLGIKLRRLRPTDEGVDRDIRSAA